MEALCVCLFTASSLVLDPHSLPIWLFSQGFRNLEDIRNQASLTTQQAIGLKHYDDFLDRMPREEAAEIEQTVSRCPRPVRRARSYYKVRAWLKAKNSGSLSRGAQQAEEAMGGQRLGLVGKEQLA